MDAPALQNEAAGSTAHLLISRRRVVAANGRPRRSGLKGSRSGVFGLPGERIARRAPVMAKGALRDTGNPDASDRTAANCAAAVIIEVMRLRFTKMQGAGNDFVVLNGIEQRLDLTAQHVRALADRRLGVGADQILVVEQPSDPVADFRYRIFNADGGEVEQCGNGARCFVMYVRQAGLTRRSSIRVQTAGGLIEPRLLDDGSVSVDMGIPNLDPATSGFSTDGLKAR